MLAPFPLPNFSGFSSWDFSVGERSRGTYSLPYLILYQGGKVSAGADGTPAGGGLPGEESTGRFFPEIFPVKFGREKFWLRCAREIFCCNRNPTENFPVRTGPGRKKSGAIAFGCPGHFPFAGNYPPDRPPRSPAHHAEGGNHRVLFAACRLGGRAGTAWADPGPVQDRSRCLLLSDEAVNHGGGCRSTPLPFSSICGGTLPRAIAGISEPAKSCAGNVFSLNIPWFRW